MADDGGGEPHLDRHALDLPEVAEEGDELGVHLEHPVDVALATEDVDRRRAGLYGDPAVLGPPRPGRREQLLGVGLAAGGRDVGGGRLHAGETRGGQAGRRGVGDESRREVPVAHLVRGRDRERATVDPEHGRLEPGPAGLGVLALEALEGRSVVALPQVQAREHVHRPQQGEVGGVGPLGDDGLEAPHGLARVARRLAEPDEDGGQVGAVDREVVLDGEGHRLVGHRDRLRGGPGVGERLGPPGEQPDPQRGRGVVAEQLQGLGGDGQPVDLLLGHPGCEGQRPQQLGPLGGGRGRAGEPCPQVRHGPHGAARGVRGGRRPEGDRVGLGVVDVEQAEGGLEVGEGLRRAAHPPGGVTGPDGGGEGQ
ncbi:MAG: hypothetical protein IE926_19785, partial [Micrococcales bacterium]|nr:hypothetical protein [Micrococcales bacterium]